MPYPSDRDYISFLRQLIDKFESSRPATRGPGRPFTYKNRVLICFFAIMQMKRCFAFKAMHRWLSRHPKKAKRLGFSKIPSRQTLSRRYKALYEVMKEFTRFVSGWSSSLGEEFQIEVVYEDKSLFKARGPVWHKKDMEANHIPENLRDLDTDATWSKSAYHGWVFGYGLHTTCTSSGFPVLVEADTASVSEHEVIERKEEDILSMNTGYLVTDDGYTDFKRVKTYARKGLLLITPALRVKSAEGESYRQLMKQYTSDIPIKARKTVIEPVFDLISRLLGTTKNHKQLPMKGRLNVRSFLALGVMLTQLALLMNSLNGLPFHNISHMLTVFT